MLQRFLYGFIAISAVLCIVVLDWFLAVSPATADGALGRLVSRGSLIPLLFALYLTVDQYNDNYILTNKRVVHEERVPLMYESRAEAPLSFPTKSLISTNGSMLSARWTCVGVPPIPWMYTPFV